MTVASQDTRFRSLPAWFKPGEFADPAFSAATYVADLQQYVPLEVLHQELQAHLSVLHGDLVEVINKDYEGFLHLTSRLTSVQGAVKRIEGPLAVVKARASATRDALLAESHALTRGLAARADAAASRGLLELMQDLTHVLSKVDKLLAELPPPGDAFLGKHSSPEAVEGQCHVLNRVTAEVARLQYQVKKGQDLAFVQTLAPRIVAAADRLQTYLDLALEAAIRQQVPTALGACLNSYASINRPQAAEQVVRSTLTRPLVEQTLAALRETTPGAAGAAAPAQRPGSGAAPAAVPPAAPLPAFLEALTRGMADELGPFLAHAMATSSGVHAFEFLGNGVLAEVLEAVQARCGADLSPGVPHAFHVGARAGDAFLEALESHATAQAQVARFRACQPYSAFMKLWNLPVYFSLQFQDIAGTLERRLGEAGLADEAAPPSPSSPAFHLAATAATWQALAASANPGSSLPRLADRFFRLGLMSLARYASWVRDVAAPGPEGSVGGGGPGASSEPGPPGAPGAPSAPPSPPSNVSLARLLADLATLGEAAQACWAPAAGPGTPGEACEACARAAAVAAESLAAAGEGARARLVAALAEECTAALSQLRGIVASFRMANRRAPAAPSPYAGRLLAPLAAFLAAHAGLLGADAAARLAREVAEGVAGAYASLAADTLAALEKTESSLRRLKSRQRMADGEDTSKGSGLETQALILLQLDLDVQAFASHIQELGVDHGSLPAFQRLREVIKAAQAGGEGQM
uniref:Conserved oligomeric Golgi complex subunit 2 n=1 Tax=Auxenochlorella protothecoides TaxID=3075 RepID=A0A1D1ZXQ3_AUXPR